MCLRMNKEKRLMKTDMSSMSRTSDIRIITIRKYNPHIFHVMKNGFSQKLTAFVQKF